MKKLIAWLVLSAMVLTLLLAIPASADEYMKYVNKAVLEVYKEPDKDSKVIKKLKGGQQVMLSGNVLFGSKFTSILIADTKHGGQLEGWVLTKYLSDDMPQSFCSHEWGKWHVDREPTCTQTGYRYRFCKICGIRDEDETAKLPHEWGKWQIVKEATCAKEGERKRTCKVCGKEEKESYLEEHTYGSWSVTKEPSCTETGARERTCKVCGYVQKQNLDMLPHDYQWKVTLEATDHSAGTRSKICVVCGKNGGEESFDPEGTLRRGAKGEAVRHIQQLLVEQGYLNAGGADGIFGGGTEKALINYQKDRDLNPDGIGWPQTLADLEHDFGPWTIVTPMTRTEDGERVRVCRGCGFEQHEIISAGTTLERGARGENVRAIQQITKQLGYDPGALDGIYGRKLDAAFAGFAADNGLVAEEGKLRPADIDALVNAWFDRSDDESWRGEGSANSIVNPALTVTEAGEPDDSGLMTYNWSLTNLGSEKATYTVMLLTFGDTPDFKANNLVMDIGGIELKPGAGNGASGTFTVDQEWGEGNLNFAVLAIHEKTGSKWLSNAVVFERANQNAAKTVAPMAYDIDVNHLADGTYPVAFQQGDVFSGASGVYMNAVHIYTEDWYDIVDINTLAVGDTVVVDGESIVVESVEQTDLGVVVNGGLDAGGVVFSTEEDSNGFCVRGYDDMPTYTDHGVTTLVVDPAATYTDASDLEAEPVTVSGADIAAAIANAEVNPYFMQFNTTVTVENGVVVAINRVYVP